MILTSSALRVECVCIKAVLPLSGVLPSAIRGAKLFVNFSDIIRFRVSRELFVRAIAVELGLLSCREIEQVETAALLHDVGKIHEEFAPLLRKEGRLTEAETALMQTHSTRSAELVGIISKFRGFIQDSVRHHHERWDGQGYPSGLSGKSIPLASRIILISDTIDAMTTDRPYRKRLALEIVVAELQKCKGTQFDPDMVEVTVSSVVVRRLITGNTASSMDEKSGPYSLQARKLALRKSLES